MQGLVGVVTGSVAAVFVGVASLPLGAATAWPLAAVAFLGTITALFAYWQRSLNELWAAMPPRYPTPPDQLDARF
jgi:hypothetical protein